MPEGALLIEKEKYLSAGVHIGTKVSNKFMKHFIFRTRGDGLAVMNVQKIDERLKLAANLLAQYEPNEIIVVCRRDIGLEVVNLFGKATGIKVFSKRYMPGTLTNTKFKNFLEAKVLISLDPALDGVAIEDATKRGIVTIALCDTNNLINKIDLVIPCNNKGKKSLGLVFYILAREYLKAKGKAIEELKIEDFIGAESSEKKN